MKIRSGCGILIYSAWQGLIFSSLHVLLKKKKKCWRYWLEASCWGIATDKALFFIRKMLISFLFLHKNICCGYSLEAPCWGASNEYPQHMFSWRNKKSILGIPPLIWSYAALLMILTNNIRFHGEKETIFLWMTSLYGPIRKSFDYLSKAGAIQAKKCF